MKIGFETRMKMREMGAADLLDALDSQDDVLSQGMTFEERF